MKFSKRQGFSPMPKTAIRKDAPEGFRYAVIDYAHECGFHYKVICLWVCRILHCPEPKTDNQERIITSARDKALYLIQTCDWYKVYDVAEDILSHIEKYRKDRVTEYIKKINNCLIEENIDWVFKQGKGFVFRGNEAFQFATSDVERDLQMSGRKRAASEIKEAIRGISRRPESNITGAITHATSALESVAKDILKKNDNFKEIVRNLDLPKPMDEAAIKLYGFASEYARHGKEGKCASFDDAILVVHICSALCTYLTKKQNHSTKKDNL